MKPHPPAERRQIENEVVFRKANERVQKGLAKLGTSARNEGHDTLIPSEDLELHFYCECSDENCHERIVMALSKYKALHRDRSRFIVCPDHETTALEEVVAEKQRYSVVEKFVTPSEASTTLNVTSVNNA